MTWRFPWLARHEQARQQAAVDAPTAVRALKAQRGDDLHVIGSAQLVESLIRHDLLDELRLMIDPILLGAGKRFFPQSSSLRALTLIDVQTATTGAMICTYAFENS